MRQDEGFEHPDQDDLARITTISNHHLHLRKRKCNYNERQQAPPLHAAQMNTDFLSGIFQDLAACDVDVDVEEGDRTRSVTYAPHDALVSSDSTSWSCCGRPAKKSRLSKTQTLSRCSKSFAKMEISAIAIRGPEDPLIPDGESLSSRSKQTPLSLDLSFSGDDDDVHPVLHVTSDSTAAKMLVDHIFSDSITKFNINFPDLPSLPATVSASSHACSSTNNLTRTSVEAPQEVFETPHLIHVAGKEHEHKLRDGYGSGYGWFVEMDDEKLRERLQAVAAAFENCRAIASPEDAGSTALSLAFAASGPKKAVHLDSEVEWAKAADTVDDVLGGILF